MFLAHVPLWVYAVLALLIGLGLRQARSRAVAPPLLTGIGVLMIGFSLWGVLSAFGAGVDTLLAWALGLGAVLALGQRLAPRGMALAAGGARVQVPGSWLPLGLMLAIFGIKFMLGYEAAVGAPIGGHSAAGLAVAVALGVLSGSFFARALAVRRFARMAVAA